MWLDIVYFVGDFSTAAMMAVKGAQLVYAANNQPLPCKGT
jgi:hypothetical protein